MAKAKNTSEASVKDYAAIIKPLITEKSSIVGGDGSKVVFEVARSADKHDIQRAIEHIFAVKVDSIRTLNYIGKLRRRGNKVGRTASFKKAYVKLKPGQTINIVEGL